MSSLYIRSKRSPSLDDQGSPQIALFKYNQKKQPPTIPSSYHFIFIFFVLFFRKPLYK